MADPAQEGSPQWLGEGHTTRKEGLRGSGEQGPRSLQGGRGKGGLEGGTRVTCIKVMLLPLL